MFWTNYHQHCYYCDGTDKPSLYVESALAKGVGSFGFSSHAPIHLDSIKWCIHPNKFNDYLDEIADLKAQYATRLPIFIGCEIDYIPQLINPCEDRFKVLDYRIGSIHFAGQFEDGTYWGIDDTKKMYQRGISEIYDGNVQAAVENYFRVTREMLAKFPPDILGHMDKIKMNNTNNSYFSEDEAWYKKAVFATLETIKASKAVVEVNTRGVYKKKTQEPYPSRWILKELLAMNIPIMLNSDAHHPREITSYYKEAADMLVSVGFKHLHIVTEDGIEARRFGREGVIL